MQTRTKHAYFPHVDGLRAVAVLAVVFYHLHSAWAPGGFARGFCALSDATEIQYKCTGIYSNKAESGILWSDPAIGIQWPLSDVVVSEKDQKAQTLAQWLASPESENFPYSPQLEVELSLRS